MELRPTRSVAVTCSCGEVEDPHKNLLSTIRIRAWTEPAAIVHALECRRTVPRETWDHEDEELCTRRGQAGYNPAAVENEKI